MVKIHIAAAGRLREPYWRAACEEYRKRLGAYCKLTERESADDADPEAPEGFWRIALCSEGEMPDSKAFAGLLARWQNEGKSRFCFLLGGSEGLGETLKQQCEYRLSLSRLTWPHHMARAMLYEQLYRAFSIQKGGKYHK